MGATRVAPARPPAAVAGPARAAAVDDLAFGLFAVVFVLVFSLDLPNPFVLPKLFVLAAYVVFAAVRWAFAAGSGAVAPLPGAVRFATAALPVWWIATLPAAQHLPTAIFGLRGRSNGLATMLAVLAVFFLVGTTRQTAPGVERRLGAIGVAMTAASVYALVQAAGLDPIGWPPGRPASTFGQPVVFGGALAIAIPFSAAFAIGGRSRRARVAWGAAAVAQGLALCLTLARGPWLAAGVGLAVIAAPTLAGRRPFARRLGRLAAAGVLAFGAILAVSRPTRALFLSRAATIASLSRDPSVAYRLHFCRAALAILRDHPLFGVGWENFGLLYPRYRSAPTAEIEADLIPTMVHSGPVQTAVSAGIPGWILQVALLVGVGVTVVRHARKEAARRARGEEAAGPQRLLGLAFLGSLVAFAVQDLSGWPHVALGGLAFSIWGLGVAWSQEQSADAVRGRWPRLALASAVAIGGAGLAADSWNRMRAERRMARAERLDVHTAWPSIEAEVGGALAVSPDRAWANDAAAKLYAAHAIIARDRRAYQRAVELANAARLANPFDPYLRLRRAEIDRTALFHGLISRTTDEGRAALDAARSLAPGSVLVRKVEASLLRAAQDSRIVWIAPGASAGFGPERSLVVAGITPKSLPGTHVYLHWRDLTLDTAWVTQPDAPVPDESGVWYNAVPDARLGHRYEVYSTSETRAVGPCRYTGNGSITLCAPIAFLDPNTAGLHPPGSLIAAGAAPEEWAGRRILLRSRDATRGADWSIRPFSVGEGNAWVSFPREAPGNWLSILAESDLAHRYEVSLDASPAAQEPCVYEGDGARHYCAPIAAIQTPEMAGFGPPGSLVVAGSARGLWTGNPVFLHWRNVTRGSGWTTQTYAPVPDARGTWYNFIPNADPRERYDVLITSPATASETCTYEGSGFRTVCP
jgi:O-antigen ligase